MLTCCTQKVWVCVAGSYEGSEKHRLPVDKEHLSGIRPRFSKVLKPKSDARHSKML